MNRENESFFFFFNEYIKDESKWIMWKKSHGNGKKSGEQMEEREREREEDRSSEWKGERREREQTEETFCRPSE